jgi:hypothetical protein
MTFDEKLAAFKARPPRVKPPRNQGGRLPQMSPEEFAEYCARTGKARRARSATRVLMGIGGRSA